MSDTLEIIGKTNFQNQYDIILGRIESTNNLIMLLQGDESNYPDHFTHIGAKLDNFNNTGDLFRGTLSTGGCQICSHHTELDKIVDFAIYKDDKIPAMKHLGVCESCVDAIEQAVKHTIENEFSEEVTSEYI